jgi:hypothetical protein
VYLEGIFEKEVHMVSPGGDAFQDPAQSFEQKQSELVSDGWEKFSDAVAAVSEADKEADKKTQREKLEIKGYAPYETSSSCAHRTGKKHKPIQ